MQAFILSDIHPDTWYHYANKPSALRGDEVKEKVVTNTLDFLWNTFGYPETDAIIVAGDVANDYLAYTRTVKWLSKKYKEVYLCLGNHDIIVRGGTPSKTNLPFKTSEEKIAAIQEFCNKMGNVHLLEGRTVDNVSGCMGMCDFKVEPYSYGSDKKIIWKREWFDGKHWRYFKQDPIAIWEHYDKMMTDLVSKQPKIMMTHFAPDDVGINFEYRLSPLNTYFYFIGKKYLDKFDHDAIWVCGHVHDKKICTYVNPKGKTITILCNPNGYPGENRAYADTMLIKDGKENRGSRPTKHEDFIIEI